MSTSTSRKATQIEPLNSTDTIEKLSKKLKSINEFLVDIKPDHLSKESKKQILSLFENLTSKELEGTIGYHPELKLLLCCAYTDLMRLVTLENEQLIKKSDYIFKNMIDMVRLSSKFDSQTGKAQLYYVLQELEQNKAIKLFVNEKTVEMTKVFVTSLLEMDDIFMNHIDLFYTTQRIITQLFQLVFNHVKDEDIQVFLFPILLSLQKKLKTSKRFELSRVIIKDLPWGVKNICGKICIDLFRKKDIYHKLQPIPEIDKVLSIIYYLFKIDFEVIRPIWPFLESEITATNKKDLRKDYIMLTARVATLKNPDISTHCQQMFNYFADALTSKKNKYLRKELLQRAFKYMRQFTYSKKVDDSEISSSTVRYDVLRKNILKLETRVKELLADADENKNFILEEIRSSALENPDIISQATLENLATMLWQTKEKSRGKILKILSEIYCHYCSQLYRRHAYDFEDRSGNFQLIGGYVDYSVMKSKEIANQFKWIGETILIFQSRASRNEFPILDNSLNIIFGAPTFDPQIMVQHLIGYFYNIWMNKYNEQASDTKGINFKEFMKQKLNYNWYYDEEVLKPNFAVLKNNLEEVFTIKMKACERFRQYLSGVLEDNTFKKDEGLAYFSNYYLSVPLLNEMEIEFTEKLQNENIRAHVMTLEDLYSPLEIKKESLEFLKEIFKSEAAQLFLHSLVTHPFCPEVYEKLVATIYLILMKELDFPIVLREVCLELLIFLIKIDPNKTLQNMVSQIVGYIIDNFEMIITQTNEKEKTQILSNKDPKKSLNKTQVISQQNFGRCCLELLTLLDLNLLIQKGESIDAESLKDYIYNLLKKLCLSPKQTKFGARLVTQIDKYTSEKLSIKLLELLVPQLNAKNLTLSVALITISEILSLDPEAFLPFMEDLTEFMGKLFETPVSLPKTDIVSELTQSKKILLKCLYRAYFISERVITSETFMDCRKKFKVFLLDILLNFSQLCAGSMKSDRDYLRIYTLQYFIDMLAKQNLLEVEPESFAKLGLLCFDESEDLKKVLFHQVITKINKKKGFLPSALIVYALFLHYSADPYLKNTAESVFKNHIERLSNDYSIFMEKTKREDLSRSAEYLIVYLIFLMANNPILLLNSKTVPYHVMRCLDFYFTHLNRMIHLNRGEYLITILDALRESEPVIYNENSKTSIDFMEVKVKKTIKKSASIDTEFGSLAWSSKIDQITAHVKEVYGVKTYNSKRLPIVLPEKLFKSEKNEAVFNFIKVPMKEDSDSAKSTPMKKMLFSVENENKGGERSPRSTEPSSPGGYRGMHSVLKPKLELIPEKRVGSDEKPQRKGKKVKSSPPRTEIISEIVSRKGSIHSSSDEIRPPIKKSKNYTKKQ